MVRESIGVVIAEVLLSANTLGKDIPASNATEVLFVNILRIEGFGKEESEERDCDRA
jgi:hypothetical protein